MFQSYTLSQLRDQRELRYSRVLGKQYLAAIKAKAFEESEAKATSLKTRFDTTHRRVHSGKAKAVVSQSTFTNFFHHLAPATLGNSSTFPASSAGEETQLPLDQFFMRPVQIGEFVVEEKVVDKINPFLEWSLAPAVRSKLRNYAFLRGNLEVTFVVTSSAYHYGTIVLSHQPYPLQNPVLLHIQDNGAIAGELNTALISYISQSPEVAYIKLGQDTEISLKIPMLLPKTTARLDVRPARIVVDDLPYTDFDGLSEIFIAPINFKDSAPVPDNVIIQVFARMMDVELGPLTATPYVITSQSSFKDCYLVSQSTFDEVRENVTSNVVVGMAASAVKQSVSDEYQSSGPATQIASAVANISAKLVGVPYIGVAAKATSMAAAVGAKVLNFFGFSRPAQLDPPRFYKQLLFNNGAVTDTSDTAFKLSVDPKQELTIEPLGGEPKIDPLSIAFLCSREAYIGTRVYDDTSVPLMTNIAVIPVQPGHTTGARRTKAMTPMAMCAEPFTYWRGTITYRFEIVCSVFARGKFLIIYEPNCHSAKAILSSRTELNQQYMVLVDIAETRDVEIEVGFVNDRMFCKTSGNNESPIFSSFHRLDLTTTSETFVSDIIQNCAPQNRIPGFLYLRPYTDFVDPNKTTSCEINVYVRSDDIEFAGPLDLRSRFSDYNVFDTRSSLIDLESAEVVSQSLIVDSGDFGQQVKEGPNTRQKCEKYLINKVKPSNDNAYLYHFGERISSFRTMLKRDHETAYFLGETTNSFYVPLYPSVFGFRGGATDGLVALPGSQVNTSGFNLFNYLRFSYLFMRGGYRHRLVYSNKVDNPTIVNRNPSSNTITAEQQFVFTVPHCNNNGTVFYDSDNQGVEFELPYYNDDLFTLSSLQPFPNGLPRLLGGADVRFHANEAPGEIMVVSSAAEDFSFFRFQGARWINMIPLPSS
jgi:hypothetical protein